MTNRDFKKRLGREHIRDIKFNRGHYQDLINARILKIDFENVELLYFKGNRITRNFDDIPLIIMYKHYFRLESTI